MTPRLSTQNVFDAAAANSELRSETFCRNAPLAIEDANASHLGSSESRTGVAIPVGSFDTTFGKGIPNIVLICSQKQMPRIAARRVIASMAAEKSFGNWTDSKDEGNAVRLGVFSSQLELAVAILILAGHPGPAFIGASAVDLGPKALRDGGGDSKLGLFSIHRMLGRASGGSSHAGAFSLGSITESLALSSHALMRQPR
jgi:hypothetical protein